MTQATRRWYHWHFGSLLTLGCVFASFVLVAGPGSRQTDWSGTGNFAYFGWPYVHYLMFEPAYGPGSTTHSANKLQDRVVRDTVRGSRQLVPAVADTTLRKPRFWSDSRNWSYRPANSAGKIFWAGLGVNVALALLVSVGCGALYEFRRRRRRSTFQFTLTDLLGFTTAIGVALGVSQLSSHRAAQDDALLRELQEKYPHVVESFNVPTFRGGLWLSRLTDERLRDFEQWSNNAGWTGLVRFLRPLPPVTTVQVRGHDAPATRLTFDPRILADELNRFPELNSLHLDSLDADQIKLLDHLHVEHIRSLSNWSESMPLDSLARFRELRELDLRAFDPQTTSWPPPKLLQLEELTVDHNHLSDSLVAWIRELPNLKVLHLWSPFFLDLEPIQRRFPGVSVRQEITGLGGAS